MTRFHVIIAATIVAFVGLVVLTAVAHKHAAEECARKTCPAPMSPEYVEVSRHVVSVDPKSGFVNSVGEYRCVCSVVPQ